MTSIRTVAPSLARASLGWIVPLVLVVCGCQSQQKAAAAAVPATPDKLAALRASIEQSQPGSQVGRVINTLGERPYAAVTDIPVQDVAVGETITFVDGDANPIASGTVIDKSSDTLFVNYRMGKRRVEQGDVAVWFRPTGGPTTAPSTQTARP